MSQNKLGGRYLCFVLGKDNFAVPLLQIKEVIGKTEITSIPSAPAYFRGILNLRGQIVPIIDLRAKLGMGKGADVAAETTIILDFDGDNVGVIVDAVNSVAFFADGQVDPPPGYESAVKMEHISAVAKSDDGKLTLILSPAKVLNKQDKAVIDGQRSSKT